MRSRTSRNRLRRPVRGPRLLTAGLLAALTLVLAGCFITPPWGTWYTSEDGTVHAVMSDAGCTMNLYARFGVTPLDGDGGYRVHSIMFNKCDAGVLGNVSLTMSTSTNGTTWSALPPVSDQADDGRSLTIHATADSDADGPTWFKVHAAGLASQGSKGWTTGADYGPFKIGPNYASWKYGGEGGNDGSVNNNFERGELLKELNTSDWDLWTGVSPADREGMLQYLEAGNAAGDTPDDEDVESDISAENDDDEPLPPVDTADLDEAAATSRSLNSAHAAAKIKPKTRWLSLRNIPGALFIGSAFRGWTFNWVSQVNKAGFNDTLSKDVWGYVKGKYPGKVGVVPDEPAFKGCAWIKRSRVEVNKGRPTGACSSKNYISPVDFASIINCDICNAGWPATVKTPGAFVFRNLPPKGIGAPGPESEPYTVKKLRLREGAPIHWRYVTKDGKWVAMYANLLFQRDGDGHKTSGVQWGFMRVADLYDTKEGALPGQGLCYGHKHGHGYALKSVRSDVHEQQGWPKVCDNTTPDQSP